VVGAPPEPFEVLRDLDRALGRRQEMKGQGHAPVGNARGLGAPEQFLEAHREDGRLGVGVVDGPVKPAGHRDVGGGPLLQAVALVVGERIAQDLGEIELLEVVGPLQAVQVREEPVLQRIEQRLVTHVGPVVAEVVVQKLDAVLELTGVVGPRQQAQPRLPDALHQRLGHRRRVGRLDGSLREREGAELLAAPGPHPLPLGGP